MKWKTWRSRFVGVFGGSANQDEEARVRVTKLLLTIQQFHELGDTLYSGEKSVTTERDWRLFSFIAESINKDLTIYVSHPSVVINPLIRSKSGEFRPLHANEPAYRWGMAQNTRSLLPQEIVAVHLIQQGDREGWLDRVRSCRTCGLWLFARKSATWHCSQKCYRKQYQKTDEYRRRRRSNHLRLKRP
jgi:hypothetical protein